MSPMITSRPSLLKQLSLSEHATVSKLKRSPESSRAVRASRAIEPPERAALTSEEPEVKVHCLTEAPDAGVGGSDRNDREFRIGRSRG
jgi:hypothetical protein